MKIFGIGLNRTGTTSLTEALEMLGYKAMHWNYTITTIDYVDGQLKIHYDKFEKYDAFVDTPVTRIYKELDQKYPGSKFILTVRDTESWLESCRRHFSPKKLKKQAPTSGMLHQEMYGTRVFDRQKFLRTRAHHMADVTAYFSGREEDLLTIDICGGDGWEKLCPFLGKSVPREKFPASNISRKSFLRKIYYKVKGYSYISR